MDDLEPAARRRPFPVTIAAWLVIVPAAAYGVLTAVFLTMSLVGFGMMSGGMGARGYVMIPFLLIGLLLGLGIPTLAVLVGVNVLRVRPWARGVTIALSALYLLLLFGPLVFGSQRPPAWQVALGAAIPTIVIILLMVRTSRDAFREAREFA